METVTFQWVHSMECFGVIHTHRWSRYTHRGSAYAKTIQMEIIDKFLFLLQMNADWVINNVLQEAMNVLWTRVYWLHRASSHYDVMMVFLSPR